MIVEIHSIEQKIKSLEAELERAKKQHQELLKLSPLCRLATVLHDEFCNLSHMDQCGWDYESGDPDAWSKASHETWLKRAEKLRPLLVGL